MKRWWLVKRQLGLLPGLLFLLWVYGLHAQSSATKPSAPMIPKARVIVFVHGLHGDKDTWRAGNGAYWPDLVRADPRFAYSDVEVAEYPSPNSNGKMSSVQLADYLFDRLRRDHVWEHREVVFVAHSLGGILVEEMLLRHPLEAASVKFVVSYGTPHEGSRVARLASIYDKDPLLNDLSDVGDNNFLTQLESEWRGHASVNGIHRFCAYEGEDTPADGMTGRYLKVRTRVVSYFSATYGCDVTTPPQEIKADHIRMVKPLDRRGAAYDFLLRVYRDNPIVEEQTSIRENVVGGLTAGCNENNVNTDLLVPIGLNRALKERVTAASASLIDMVDVREVSPNPPVVTKVDADGVAHVSYGFRGPGKKMFACLGTARASVRVEFTVVGEVAIREPGS